MKKYVTIKENERFVTCPFCGTKIDLDDVFETACEHLDNEDYITPRGPFEKGYDVWFNDEQEGISPPAPNRTIVG